MPVHNVFTEHLNTNYVPSELEVPLLERIVAEYKSNADALASEIEQAERALSPLKDQRAACLKMMEEHLALLSCARTIPIEILQLIFQECVVVVGALDAQALSNAVYATAPKNKRPAAPREPTRTLPSRRGVSSSQREDQPIYELDRRSGKPPDLTNLEQVREPIPETPYGTPDATQTTFSVAGSLYSDQRDSLSPLGSAESSVYRDALPSPPGSPSPYSRRPLPELLTSRPSNDIPQRRNDESSKEDSPLTDLSAEQEAEVEALLDEPDDEEKTEGDEIETENESTTMTKTKADMPLPGTRGAPSFKGKAKKLEEFWDLFEDLAKICNVEDKDKPELAVRYVKSSKDKKLWKALPGYSGASVNYETWKKAVNESYAEDEKEDKMTIADLERLVRRSAKKKISKERHLLKYHRNFILVANPLVSGNTIADQQKNLYFWRGLHPRNQAQILTRLNITKASTRKPEDIPTMDDVMETGKFLYSSRSFEQTFGSSKKKGRKSWDSNSDSDSSSESSEDSSSSESSDSESESESSDSEEERKRRKKKGKGKERSQRKKMEVTTKRVAFEMGKKEDPVKKKLDEVEELSRKLSGMRVNDIAYAGCYMRLKAIEPSLVTGIPSPWSSASESYSVNATAVGRPFGGGGYAGGGRPSWGHQRSQSAGSGYGCFFCGDQAHMMRDCPGVQDYIAKGRCKFSLGNRLVFMDGTYIAPVDGLLKNAVNEKLRQSEFQHEPAPHSKGKARASSSSAPVAGFVRLAETSQSFATVAEVVEEDVIEDVGRVWLEGRSDVWSDEEWKLGADGGVWKEVVEEDEEEMVLGLVEVLEKHEDGTGVAAAVTRSKKGKKKGEGKEKEEKVNVKASSEGGVERVVEARGGERVREEKVQEGGATSTKANSGPAYTYGSKIPTTDAASKIFDRILDAVVPEITVRDLVSLSSDLRKDVVDKLRTVRIPANEGARAERKAHHVGNALAVSGVRLEHSEPIREIDCVVAGCAGQVGTLDEGSELVILREEKSREFGLNVNDARVLTMEAANGSRNELEGCAEWVEIEVGGLKTWAHAYIVKDAPYDLLLGRPWLKSVRLQKIELESGVDVVIHNPQDYSHSVRLATRPRGGLKRGGGVKQVGLVIQEMYNDMPDLMDLDNESESDESDGEEEDVQFELEDRDLSAEEQEEARESAMKAMREAEDYIKNGNGDLASVLLNTTFKYDRDRNVFVYKKVANKIKPVATTTPEKFKIHRYRPVVDPLTTVPELPAHAPEFEPGERLTQERLESLGVMENEFLTEEERKLVVWILKTHETVLAFDESQKGRFKEDIFPPIIFPVIEHIPWAVPTLPIPPAIHEEVVRVIKAKVNAGTYEPSTSSYRHQWFCVAKKDGSVRIVHNLGPLNQVTIRDAGQMPVADHFAEVCAGRGIYTSIDLFVGFDHRTIAEESRDLTAFDTPLGTHRLTVLPQGWTNSPTIFHADVAWIIQDLIPKVLNLADDIQGLGPRTRYEQEDGSYEVTKENPSVRRFVREHLEDVNRLLHVLGDAGATISAKKLYIAVPEAVVMGQLMTYDGRKPERTKVVKIETWPPCTTVSEVRGFLGTAGTVRNWIRDFARIAHPLVELTKKGVEWRWTSVEQEAMDSLKAAVVASEAIRPIDYKSSNEVVLAVDSSHIACGYILLQLDDENRRRPARFGSITFNEREARYSQAKLELYGLFRSIHAVKLWIIGVANLTVETDAKYIKGMLNHPDMHPNAAVNRWISAILLFPFKLVHVPAAKHQGPDGLSRRRATEDEGDDLGDAEEWIEEVLNCGLWVARTVESETRKVMMLAEDPVVGAVWVLEAEAEKGVQGSEIEREEKDGWVTKDNELRKIKALLEGVGVSEEAVPAEERERLVKRAVREFFVSGGRLWRKERGGRHQVVILDEKERLAILKETHDNLGHHGMYSTRRLILDRFWWPSVQDDIRWYIRTCHACQLMSTQKVVIPPVVSTPATLFRVVYIDTMHLPPSNGYTYLVQARCGLSGWVEFRSLKKESARTIGAFIFEELLCRWGRLEKLVTDNGTAYVAALKYLEDRYDLTRVPISPYNSKANGAVETTHRTVRDALVKVTADVGGMKRWSEHVHHVMWADRITTRKRTGFSPFFAAHGVEPLLPFDIVHATFLLSDLKGPISDAELLAIRARQLERRDKDLQLIRDRVIASRFASIEAFKQKFKHTIVDYDFKPGDLVLVLNKKIEPELGRKAKPRYYGPMVVVSRGSGGAYRLAEVNGAVSKLKYAAFRLIPYYRRYTSHIDVTELLDAENEVGDGGEDV